MRVTSDFYLSSGTPSNPELNGIQVNTLLFSSLDFEVFRRFVVVTAVNLPPPRNVGRLCLMPLGDRQCTVGGYP